MIRVIEKPDVEKGGRAKSSDINCNRLFHDTKGQRHQTHHLWSNIIRIRLYSFTSCCMKLSKRKTYVGRTDARWRAFCNNVSRF